jgi:hypothetical protein
MSREPETAGGLTVRKDHFSWRVLHAASGLTVVDGLRMRRFADDARRDLLATGADFTGDARETVAQRDRFAAVCALWLRRSRQDFTDPVTFEHYSWSTHYGHAPNSAAKAAELREQAAREREARDLARQLDEWESDGGAVAA